MLFFSFVFFFFFFNDTATTEIYTLSLHDALPISTLAWTVSHGRRAKLWKTIAVPGLGPVTGLPRNVTVPLDGAMRPAMQRSRVDLPLPLLPSSARISPSRTSRSMLSRTGSSLPGVLKVLVRPRHTISGAASSIVVATATPPFTPACTGAPQVRTGAARPAG